MPINEYWIYDIKCRRCGKINSLLFGIKSNIDKSVFNDFVSENSGMPQFHQCDCYNEGATVHDIVSFNNIY